MSPRSRSQRAGNASKTAGSEQNTPGYRVGYGCPPKHSQFKPGQSGNLRGRPKRHRNLKTVVQSILLERVQLRQADRTLTVSSSEALVRKLLSDALQGNAKATAVLIALVRLVGLTADEPDPQADAALTADDDRLLAGFIERHAGELLTSDRTRPRRKGERR
jgi:hypothetical protein